MNDDSGLDAAQLTVWRDYLAVHAQLVGHLQQHAQRRFDVSAADYEVLARLAESEDRRIPVADMAAAIMWEKSRLSHQLTRMADRGLIRREDSDSRRYPDIVLTEKGHALIAEARPAHAALVRALFIDALGPDYVNHLATASDKILQALEAHRDTDCSMHSF